MINVDGLIKRIANNEITELSLANETVASLIVKSKIYTGDRYHGYHLYACGKLQNGQIALSVSNQQCLTWDIVNGNLASNIKLPINGCDAAVLLPNNMLALAGYSDRKQSIKLVNYGDFRIEKTFQLKHENRIDDLIELPGNRLASAGIDGKICIWNIQTGECTKVIDCNKQNISALALLPDGRLVSTTAKINNLQIWNLQTGQCELLLQGHSGNINSGMMKVLSKGLLVSASEDGTVRIWDPKTGDCSRVLQVAKVLEGAPSSLAVLTTDLLAIGSTKYISLWDPYTGDCLAKIACKSDRNKIVEFSRNLLAVINVNENMGYYYSDLSMLNIETCPLNEQELGQIFNGLKNNTSVKKLDLSKVNLSPANISDLRQMLEKRTDLEALDLIGTGLSDSEQREILAKLPRINPPLLIEPEPELPPADTIKQHPYVIELEQRLADYTARLDIAQQQLAEQQAKSDALDQRLMRQEQAAQQMQTQLSEQLALFTAKFDSLTEQLSQKVDREVFEQTVQQYDEHLYRRTAEQILQRLRISDDFAEVLELITDADEAVVEGLSLLRFSANIGELDELTKNSLLAKGLVLSVADLLERVEQVKRPRLTSERAYVERLLLGVEELASFMENLDWYKAMPELQSLALEKLGQAVQTGRLAFTPGLTSVLKAIKKQDVLNFEQGECKDEKFIQQIQAYIVSFLDNYLDPEKPKLAPDLLSLLQGAGMGTGRQLLNSKSADSRLEELRTDLIGRAVNRLTKEFKLRDNTDLVSHSFAQLVQALQQLHQQHQLPAEYTRYMQNAVPVHLLACQDRLDSLLHEVPSLRSGPTLFTIKRGHIPSEIAVHHADTECQQKGASYVQ